VTIPKIAFSRFPISIPIPIPISISMKTWLHAGMSGCRCIGSTRMTTAGLRLWHSGC
jgi:hypothetical protein